MREEFSNGMGKFYGVPTPQGQEMGICSTYVPPRFFIFSGFLSWVVGGCICLCYRVAVFDSVLNYLLIYLLHTGLCFVDQ